MIDPIKVSDVEIEEFIKNHEELLIQDIKTLKNTMGVLIQLRDLSSRLLPLRAYFNLIQDLQKIIAIKQHGVINTVEMVQRTQRDICTEVTFVAACAIMGISVYRAASIYTIKGTAEDYKDTRVKNREIVSLDSDSLKDIISALSRPEKSLKMSEQNFSIRAFNYLKNQYNLFNLIPKIREWITQEQKKGLVVRRNNIIHEFDLTFSDYQKLEIIAKKNGKLLIQNSHLKWGDMPQIYKLPLTLHKRLEDYAERNSLSPLKAACEILDRFLSVEEQERVKRETSRGI